MGDTTQELLIFLQSLLMKPTKLICVDYTETLDSMSWAKQWTVPKEQIWLIHQAKLMAGKKAGATYSALSCFIHQKSHSTTNYMFLIKPATISSAHFVFPSNSSADDVLGKSPAIILPEGKIKFDANTSGDNLTLVLLSFVYSVINTVFLETLPVQLRERRGFWNFLR